jgi:hypothetical protein
MSKSKQAEGKAPVRHTVRPGISSPIFLQTVSGATCHLRRVDDVDPTRSLKLFADDEGIICFHVRPSVEAEVIAKFVIECEADAKITHYPLELRGSRKDTPEMPFPDKERPPRKERQSVRPALSREEGLRLSDKELLERGYPPRPDAKAVAPFRTWLKAVSAPATIVKPRIVTNTGVSHRHVHRVGSVASNWSGFELRGGPFSSISGGWNVPPIVFGETGLVTQSSFWVGIDGDGTNDLVQAGTAQNNVVYNISGQYLSISNYHAWSQFLPQQPNEQVFANLQINPGDQIETVVLLLDSEAFFVIENITRNETVSVTTPYGNTIVKATDAEWIMERPTVNNNFTDLAQYITASMYYAIATIGHGGNVCTYDGTRISGTIGNLESLQITMKNGPDALSEVIPGDDYSMLFFWSGFH